MREWWSTSSSLVLRTPFRPTPFLRMLFTASSIAAVSDMRPLGEGEREREGRGGRRRGRDMWEKKRGKSSAGVTVVFTTRKESGAHT